MDIATPEDNETNPRITFGEVELLELADGSIGYQVSYTLRQDSEGSLYIWTVADGLTVFATLSAAPGEAASHQENVLHIINSAAFTGNIEAVLSDSTE
jgi:hypothetical protein